MSSLKEKFIRGVFWSLSDKLINQLGYLAVTIYLARIIGPEGFGLIGMLTIFMLLLDSTVSNGFSQALVQKSKFLTDDDCSTVLYTNIAWGLFIFCVLYWAAPAISRFYDEPALTGIARLLFIVVVINSLSVVVRAKFLIAIDFKSQAGAGVGATILSSILAVYLALNNYGYWALCWLIISRSTFNTIFLWLLCRWVPKLVFNVNSFKSIFKFGSNLMLAGFVATLVNNLYVALIGRYFKAADVGYFTQANNLSSYLMQLISSTLQGVSFPLLSSLQDDNERLRQLYKKFLSAAMMVSLPVMIGFSAVSNEFVLLFLGDEWLPIVPVLSAICIARTITPISVLNMNILNAVGRSDLFLKVDLSKLPLTLGALYVAIPYGIQGVAWALIVTSFISFFINAYYPGKLFGFGAFKQLRVALNYILAASVMYFSVAGVVLDSMILALVVKVILGAFVYVAVLFFLGDVFLRQCIEKVVLKIKSL
ncbi:MAG: lipopolysaccharide biosynthesis protein [Alishewanella agri]|nr:lipopolysaccharide biosynthesis protein [Alishewanella agri]